LPAPRDARKRPQAAEWEFFATPLFFKETQAASGHFYPAGFAGHATTPGNICRSGKICRTRVSGRIRLRAAAGSKKAPKHSAF